MGAGICEPFDEIPDEDDPSYLAGKAGGASGCTGGFRIWRDSDEPFPGGWVHGQSGKSEKIRSFDGDDSAAGKGSCQISGIPVENVVFPAMDVICEESWKALETLQQVGVHVYFADQLPAYRAERMEPFVYYDFREEAALQNRLTIRLLDPEDGQTSFCGKDGSFIIRAYQGMFLLP